MAEVPVMINGVLWDKQWKVGRPVVIYGVSWNPTLEIGGGPMPGGPEGHPEHPIFYPPGIWGPTDPRPTPPINLPPWYPNEPPPINPPDDASIVKPPPPDGGWGWSPEYGWGWFPGTSNPGPKRR